MQWKICIKYAIYAGICINIYAGICSYISAINMQIYAKCVQVFAIYVNIYYRKY